MSSARFIIYVCLVDMHRLDREMIRVCVSKAYIAVVIDTAYFISIYRPIHMWKKKINLCMRVREKGSGCQPPGWLGWSICRMKPLLTKQPFQVTLSGRLKFTYRRHHFLVQDFLFLLVAFPFVRHERSWWTFVSILSKVRRTK